MRPHNLAKAGLNLVEERRVREALGGRVGARAANLTERRSSGPSRVERGGYCVLLLLLPPVASSGRRGDTESIIALFVGDCPLRDENSITSSWTMLSDVQLCDTAERSEISALSLEWAPSVYDVLVRTTRGGRSSIVPGMDAAELLHARCEYF